jgi:hypothetical protein
MYVYHAYNQLSSYSHLLPVLAKALKVSTDELMGVEKTKKNGKTQDTRL